jgi:hypothetical protein
MSAVQGLRLSRLAIMGLVAGLLGCLGCECAHYVVRNPTSGVIAIPEDTPALRAKAEKLMHEQFPGGYVLDDVRMVAVGPPRHPHEEVMLYYHAGAPTSTGAPVLSAATPAGPAVVPHVQPASFTSQPASLTSQPGELPPQPIPVNGR